MSFLRKVIKAGKTKYVSYYYSQRYHSKSEGGRREKKKKPSSEAQKKVNLRNAELKLTMEMNANFNSSCWYLTFDYRPEERPDCKVVLHQQMKNYLKRLRRVYKKAGQVLKYIWVAEIGPKGACHIHMVISEINISFIRNLWKHGGVHFQPLWDDGNYRKLAHYFIKYSEKTKGTTGELQGKRWNASKNLIIPIGRTRKNSSRDRFSKTPVVPDGWYLDYDSVQQGMHEITGYHFLNYILVRLE